MAQYYWFLPGEVSLLEPTLICLCFSYRLNLLPMQFNCGLFCGLFAEYLRIYLWIICGLLMDYLWASCAYNADYLVVVFFLNVANCWILSKCCKVRSLFIMLQILQKPLKCCKYCRDLKTLQMLQNFQFFVWTTCAFNADYLLVVFSICCKFLQ